VKANAPVDQKKVFFTAEAAAKVYGGRGRMREEGRCTKPDEVDSAHGEQRTHCEQQYELHPVNMANTKIAATTRTNVLTLPKVCRNSCSHVAA